MTDAGEDDGRARYVAIITDGNGRWAKARDLPVVEGHKAGADTVKARLRDAAELGIRELTVYSFSTENWSRPAEEVTGLMRMFSQRILAETPELKEDLRATTERAFQDGVRGVPTVRVGGQLFFGDDRLEDAAAAL